MKIVENLVNAVQEKDEVRKVVFKKKKKRYPCNKGETKENLRRINLMHKISNVE